MTPGGKDGGKHWTRAEVESRQAAQEMTKRKTKVRLIAPDWLSPAALEIWKKVKKQVVGLDLLDNLDTEMLAIYCDAVAQYRVETEKLRRFTREDGEVIDRGDMIKAVQSWARIVSTYAEKLGFTPSGRARLIKKRAEEIERDRFGDEFDK
jgi:P27 family predicted phage terminase small subunit